MADSLATEPRICYIFRMSQIRLIKLKSTKSPHVIWTRKNKKTVERKIELVKFDPTLKKRVTFKEAKK
jgi:ribosomal protein L33